MNLVFLISVILKGVGAVLTILLQVLITRGIGLSAYGTYNTMISTADLLFWCFFSGIVKCNTFYLSGEDSTLNHFKKKYYGFYVLPFILILCVICTFLKEPSIWIIAGITLAEVMMMDRSSSLLAEKRYYQSLVGEYILGRFCLLLMVLFLWKTDALTTRYLICAYLVQYLLVILFYMLTRERKKRKDLSEKVSLKKWGEFQKSDVLQSVVGEMPVILQYIAAGSFEAGVLSVINLVNRMVNFISGPASKVFLPEFSRLYHANKKEELCKSYASIMRIQMLFVGPLSVVLLGYPKVIPTILAEEMIPYQTVFLVSSSVFLFTATLGPCGGLLQMSGNEKTDNRCRIVSIFIMFAAFIILRENSLFVIYGLCIQRICESVSKYIFVCRWMEQMPVNPLVYAGWWLLPGAAIALTYIFQLQESFWIMLLMAGTVFIIQVVMELKKENGYLNGRRKILS